MAFDPYKKFSFENLEAYKVATELIVEVYELQRKFPREEIFALGDQVRRSASSITSNIAEGTGRNSIKEKIHFIEIAFGSMTESFSQLQITLGLNYLTLEEIEAVRPLYNRVAALLSLLKRSYEIKA